MERSYHGLIWRTIPAVAWRDWENPENFSVDSLCLGRGSSAWRSLCVTFCLRQSVLRTGRIGLQGTGGRYLVLRSKERLSRGNRKSVYLIHNINLVWLTFHSRRVGIWSLFSLFKEDRVLWNNSLDSIVSKLPCRNIDAVGSGKLKTSYFSDCKWYGFSKWIHFALVSYFPFRFLSVERGIDSRGRLSSAAACDMNIPLASSSKVSEVPLRTHTGNRLSTAWVKIN